jgi:hypothetical protein
MMWPGCDQRWPGIGDYPSGSLPSSTQRDVRMRPACTVPMYSSREWVVLAGWAVVASATRVPVLRSPHHGTTQRFPKSRVELTLSVFSAPPPRRPAPLLIRVNRQHATTRARLIKANQPERVGRKATGLRAATAAYGRRVAGHTQHLRMGCASQLARRQPTASEVPSWLTITGPSRAPSLASLA